MISYQEQEFDKQFINIANNPAPFAAKMLNPYRNLLYWVKGEVNDVLAL